MARLSNLQRFGIKEKAGEEMISIDLSNHLTRRTFVAAAASFGGLVLMGHRSTASSETLALHKLAAEPGKAALRGKEAQPVDIWGYNGTAPGPVLRIRQGDELRVRLRNGLHQPTTLHWHGIRIANAMDGVPGLTQKAVEPGESFDYRFACPDAGTFWYHPHKLAAEQVARGLHGILIVEEKNPPQVDQDRLIVLDDWRLDKEGQIHSASFASIGERAHGGRFGNTFTCNGSTHHEILVRAGQRIRFRFCNVANASSFAAQIADHDAHIIAIDGQPVSPFKADKGVILLSPGQRVDAIVDMTGKPGSMSTVRLLGFEQEVSVGSLVYAASQIARSAVLDTDIQLPPNPLPTNLDLPNAVNATLMMEGGAMGGMRGAKVDGQFYDMRRLVQQFGYVWSFNGTAGMPDEPLARIKQGQTVRLRMINNTGWPHAMHIHGHHFKQIKGTAGDGYGSLWRDTIVLRRGQEITTAFVADNPGKWMLHCHMLEHQEGGMATWFEVVR